MDEVDDLEARECPKCHGLMVKQEIDETHLLYITTGPEISPKSFIQDVLKTLEAFKKA